MSEQPAALQRFPGWRRAAASGLGLVGLIVLALWFFGPDGGATQPVHLQRQADGVLAPDSETAGGSPLQLSASAGTLQSSNTRSSVSHSHSADPAWFAGKSLHVVNESDHLLMQRVGATLLEELRKDKSLQSIDYFPAGHRPEHGAVAPDVIVTLELVSIDESGLIGRDLECKVLTTLGTSYAASSHHASGSSDPPFLQLMSHACLDHKSSLAGVESAGARYSIQGRDIGREIAKHLLDDLKKLRDEHDPPTVDLAVAEFREPLAFAFLAELKAEELSALHGVMLHNDTFWRFPAETDVAAAIERIRSELEAAGWRVSRESVDPESPHFSAARNSQRLEVFQERGGTQLSSVDDVENARRDLLVRYTARMDSDEIKAWYGSLLADPESSLDALLALHRYGGSEGREQLLARAAEHPPHTAAAWLTLSTMHEKRGERDAAVRAIRCAYAYSLLGGQSRHTSSIRSQARKIELSEKDLKVIDRSIWETCGIPRLDEAAPTAVLECRSDEIAAIVVGADDNWSVCGVRLRPEAPGRYELRTFEADHQGTSWWSTSSAQDLTRGRRESFDAGGSKVHMELQELSPGRFRATATLAPAEATTGDSGPAALKD